MQQNEKEHRQNSIYFKRFCFSISILGVITVTAVGAGEATITVKCGTAEDVVIEATVDEAGTPEEDITAYYYENFSADYVDPSAGTWDITKGLANYKLAGFDLINDAGTAYEGKYYLKVKMNDVYNGITYTLDNSEGETDATYTFSAYLKATGVTGEQFVRMGVENTYTDTSYWTATDTWTKITKDVKVVAGSTKTIVFSAQDPEYCDADAEQMACVFIDKVVIEKKDAVAGTPEEDITAYYYENFTEDYVNPSAGTWDITNGLANYKLAGFDLVDDAETAYEGNYYLKIKMNDVYNGITYTLDNSTGEAETTFTFSAYLKATGVAGEQFVRMGVGNTYTDTSYWTATDTWTKITKEVKVAAGATETIVFSAQDPEYCDADAEQMACVYIDKVVIEKSE